MNEQSAKQTTYLLINVALGPAAVKTVPLFVFDMIVNVAHVVYASPLLENMLGYDPEEMTGIRVELVMPDVAEFAFKDANVSGCAVGLPMAARKKDGSELAVLVGLCPSQISQWSFVICFVVAAVK